MTQVKIIERGWAGHFICSSRCRYKRNTLIQYGKKRYVVSTIGNYYPTAESVKPETIGIYRYYETMAFAAKWDDPYWEADVTKEISFNSPWQISEIEFETDIEADRMHEKVVKELTKKITCNTPPSPSNSAMK